jgi:hypothetical protein
MVTGTAWITRVLRRFSAPPPLGGKDADTLTSEGEFKE